MTHSALDQKLDAIKHCILKGWDEDLQEHLFDLLRGINLKNKSDDELTSEGLKLKTLFPKENFEIIKSTKMNSKFKFRIWHQTDKKFIFFNGNENKDNHNVWLKCNGELTSTKYSNPELDQMIVQFSTNLKDKHGKDIYEGDIIECFYWFDGYGSKPKNKIQKEVRCFVVSNIHPESSGGPDGVEVFEDVEVIGHIHDGKNYDLH